MARFDHQRHNNQEWRFVTEREPDYVPRYADERDAPLVYQPTALDLEKAEQIREDLEAHRQHLNARQPHIERNARKGIDL